MKKINIAELLKDCPKGMELYSRVLGECKFNCISNTLDRIIVDKAGDKYTFTYDGRYHNFAGECVLFPKGKTTWEGFVPPCQYKDGDILAFKTSVGTTIFIHRNKKGEHTCKTSFYVGLDSRGKLFVYSKNGLISLCGDCDTRLATVEEKQKLFDVIKANGYKWNAETKTLEKEKFIVPKFKVEDTIRYKRGCKKLRIASINQEEEYYLTHDYEIIYFKHQDDWELVPNKFDITTLKPFDKVLVRHNEDNKWCGSFFSHIDEDLHSHCCKFVTTSGKSYPYCILYEGNQELLGTTNNPKEY